MGVTTSTIYATRKRDRVRESIAERDHLHRICSSDVDTMRPMIATIACGNWFSLSFAFRARLRASSIGDYVKPRFVNVTRAACHNRGYGRVAKRAKTYARCAISVATLAHSPNRVTQIGKFLLSFVTAFLLRRERRARASRGSINYITSPRHGGTRSRVIVSAVLALRYTLCAPTATPLKRLLTAGRET